ILLYLSPMGVSTLRLINSAKESAETILNNLYQSELKSNEGNLDYCLDRISEGFDWNGTLSYVVYYSHLRSRNKRPDFRHDRLSYDLVKRLYDGRLVHEVMRDLFTQFRKN